MQHFEKDVTKCVGAMVAMTSREAHDFIASIETTQVPGYDSVRKG